MLEITRQHHATCPNKAVPLHPRVEREAGRGLGGSPDKRGQLVEFLGAPGNQVDLLLTAPTRRSAQKETKSLCNIWEQKHNPAILDFFLMCIWVGVGVFHWNRLEIYT